MSVDIIFLITILVISVIIHEVSHGFAANWLGDPTAKLQGRLTLNPISHIDPMGSIILPAILVFSGSPFLFGWAKPVPYNPHNLQKGGRWAESIVAIAGPASNVLVAVVFGIIIRLGLVPANALSIVGSIVFLNILLAIFNLIPIPPLDGSKIFSQILPSGLAFQYEQVRNLLERNIFIGFGVVILFVMVFGGAFFSFVSLVTNFLIGA